jgi:hypothetical protein
MEEEEEVEKDNNKKDKPVVHLKIIAEVKHHVLFQCQLIFVENYPIFLLYHVIFLVTI